MAAVRDRHGRQAQPGSSSRHNDVREQESHSERLRGLHLPPDRVEQAAALFDQALGSQPPSLPPSLIPAPRGSGGRKSAQGQRKMPPTADVGPESMDPENGAGQGGSRDAAPAATDSRVTGCSGDREGAGSVWRDPAVEATMTQNVQVGRAAFPSPTGRRASAAAKTGEGGSRNGTGSSESVHGPEAADGKVGGRSARLSASSSSARGGGRPRTAGDVMGRKQRLRGSRSAEVVGNNLNGPGGKISGLIKIALNPSGPTFAGSPYAQPGIRPIITSASTSALMSGSSKKKRLQPLRGGGRHTAKRRRGRKAGVSRAWRTDLSDPYVEFSDPRTNRYTHLWDPSGSDALGVGVATHEVAARLYAAQVFDKAMETPGATAASDDHNGSATGTRSKTGRRKSGAARRKPRARSAAAARRTVFGVPPEPKQPVIGASTSLMAAPASSAEQARAGEASIRRLREEKAAASARNMERAQSRRRQIEREKRQAAQLWESEMSRREAERRRLVAQRAAEKAQRGKRAQANSVVVSPSRNRGTGTTQSELAANGDQPPGRRPVSRGHPRAPANSTGSHGEPAVAARAGSAAVAARTSGSGGTGNTDADSGSGTDSPVRGRAPTGATASSPKKSGTPGERRQKSSSKRRRAKKSKPAASAVDPSRDSTAEKSNMTSSDWDGSPAPGMMTASARRKKAQEDAIFEQLMRQQNQPKPARRQLGTAVGMEGEQAAELEAAIAAQVQAAMVVSANPTDTFLDYVDVESRPATADDSAHGGEHHASSAAWWLGDDDASPSHSGSEEPQHARFESHPELPESHGYAQPWDIGDADKTPSSRPASRGAGRSARSSGASSPHVRHTPSRAAVAQAGKTPPRTARSTTSGGMTAAVQTGVTAADLSMSPRSQAAGSAVAELVTAMVLDAVNEANAATEAAQELTTYIADRTSALLLEASFDGDSTTGGSPNNYVRSSLEPRSMPGTPDNGTPKYLRTPNATPASFSGSPLLSINGTPVKADPEVVAMVRAVVEASSSHIESRWEAPEY